MNESDKTNELDNFGVWVKKPPRTVSSEDFSENEGADAGDKGMEDIDINAFMDGADFSDGSQDKKEEPAQAESSPSNETEEVSLDEFLDGGVFEGDDGGSAASEKSEQESKAAFEANPEPVPVEDFSSSSDITVSDSEPAAASDDSPLDIDLSFDDEPAASDSSSSSEPQFETIDSFDSPASQSSGLTSSSPSSSNASSDGTESVDLSEFGFDIDAPESTGEEKTEEKPQETQSSSSGETEDVDLSEFGFDIDAPENPAEEKAPEQAPAQAETKAEEPSSQETEPAQTKEAPQAPAETHNIDENGMEEVSLDDFGFDINAEEGAQPSSKEDISDEKKINLETPAEQSSDSDDDSQNISLDTSASSPIEDADLDSISLDSPSPNTTENGAKDDEKTIAESEASPEQKSENNDDLNLNSELEEIPDSFDEETASLFAEEPKENASAPADAQTSDEEKTIAENVVDQSEPVFEETAVDLSELPDEIPEIEDNDSNQKTEDSSNPFTLPPDNAFKADSEQKETETAEKSETTQQENSPAEEKSTEEKIADATSGKDNEIAASTNAILSQIVSELASLKTEISGLKNEVEEIKSKGPEIPEAPEANENSPATETNKNTGFFSENGEDDTIALSVDELDNILNNAEMVNDDSEKEKDSLTENNDDNIFEEPAVPENEFEETISDNNDLLPDYTYDDGEKEEDIFVPKAEEIGEAQTQIDFGNLDEEEQKSDSEPKTDDSSSDDSTLTNDDFSIGDFSFDDDDKTENANSNVADTAESAEPEESSSENETISLDEAPAENAEDLTKEQDEKAESLDSPVDEPFNFGSETTAEDETSASENKESDETAEPEKSEEKSVSISNEELDNLLAPDPSINDSLTDENLNYLASDKELVKDETQEEDSESSIPGNLKKEIKSVLSYMDQLLENLPEDKIAEFAQSEQFETYKKLFKELGLDKQ